jgi:glycosyltransferase involved in cell wall biosynthesis
MLQRQYSLAQKRVILYAGSLALASHRVDLLLRAFAQVVEQVDDAILMLVGGGEDRQRLLDLSAELGIAGSVIHVGRVSPEQVPLYYGLAYLSVDPVSDDGAARGRSPLKLYESLALGVPVVTADVGDRRLALGDGHHGFLVEPGSVDSLASILVDALRQPQQVETRRSNILADRDRMNLYWDQLVDDFERVYGPDLLMEVEAINK